MQEALYVVTFESGETQEEYGKDTADVRAFINRSYQHMGKIASIKAMY